MTDAPGPLRSGRLLIGGLAVFGGLLILGRLASDLYVDVLWYETVGYADVFYRRLAFRWGTRLVWAGIVIASLFFSLRLIARTLGGIQIKRRFGNLEIIERLPRAYVFWGIVALSLLVGAWFGGAISDSASWALPVALQGVKWGVADPVLGKDLSYYVFTLPLLRSVLGYLMVLDFLLLVVAVAGYVATGAVRWGRRGFVMGDQPRIHVGTLIAIFIALLGMRFLLAQSLLLLSGNSRVLDIFGYADAGARLPALRIMAVVTLAAAGVVMWGVWTNRLVPVVSGLATVLVGSLAVLQFYPSLVQRFRVIPNELERETPFIEHNMEFTRLGFALTDVERRSFRYQSTDSTDWGAVGAQLTGLPIWPADVLLTALKATEARFKYYDFQSVDFARYTPPGGGEPQPVAISVREVDPTGIQDVDWQNLHLRPLYVAGMGAVAVAAAGRTPEGRPPMYLSGIPPEYGGAADSPDLRLTRPEVYFGSLERTLSASRYGIVSAPSAGTAPDFPQGIQLDGAFRKLALAWRFRDANLLFSSEVSDSSRFLFRRHVRERAEAIAPFFRYPELPYPVIVRGRIVWVLEGFSATRSFPLASSVEVQSKVSPPFTITYLRNSVKVTVDAVSGETRFYRLPVEDPLRDAYAQAFPGVLRPIDEMPAELREHLRYSTTMLTVQSAVLAGYHQETAARFHGQQDVWDRPQELSNSTSPVPYVPEYGLYRLPDERTPTFNLTSAFVPAGRQNLTALIVGRLDESGAPQLLLFDVPVEDQAPGPRQVEALVEQDPEISQEFSLWRSGGSQVWTGHLHIVPVGTQLFFMEPVFLAAADQAIPELRRFVVSDGRRVAMEPTLGEAIAVLTGNRLPAVITTAPGLPGAGAGVTWAREALGLLERAESRLRASDYAGFGASIQELRRLLEHASAPVGGAAPRPPAPDN